MSKKSRFDMLEVEPVKKESGEAKAPAAAPVEDAKNRSTTPEFKVIVEQDEFKLNVQKHTLQKQKNEIKREKVRLEEEVAQLKQLAWLKIYVGIGIMCFALFQVLMTFQSERLILDKSRWLKHGIVFGVGLLIQIFWGRNKPRKK